MTDDNKVNGGAGAMSTATAELAGMCPFCGGTWVIGSVQGEDMPAVLHSIPMCADFELREPAEYVTHVRQAIAGKKVPSA